MKNNLGIYIDKSSLRHYCLEDSSKSPYKEDNLKLFAFLRQHIYPIMGIITDRIRDSVRVGLSEDFRYQKSRKRRCMQRLDELGDFTVIEKVNPIEFDENLSKVKSFFTDLKKELPDTSDLKLVSSRFRNIIRSVRFDYSEKIFFERPENEDKKVLAEAVCLSKKYNPIFLVSLDGHFSDEFVSGEIEKVFGVVSGYPQDILSKVRKYDQYLFKENPISNHVGS